MTGRITYFLALRFFRRFVVFFAAPAAFLAFLRLTFFLAVFFAAVFLAFFVAFFRFFAAFFVVAFFAALRFLAMCMTSFLDRKWYPRPKGCQKFFSKFQRFLLASARDVFAVAVSQLRRASSEFSFVRGARTASFNAFAHREILSRTPDDRQRKTVSDTASTTW
ncbi:MAG: hypothetical protein H6817_01105 [Phycisphaerales bacterium]|nr:hypothetical protein [Phycisphaerales bacterium]